MREPRVPFESGPAIEIEGLVKRYRRRPPWRDLARLRFAGGAREVLRGITFDIGRGELFGLLGPNGAGKTTLLKILATLIAPDGGRARISGLDLIDDGARVRRILGSVPPEERSLFWRLSARENLELFAGLHGLDAAAARARSGRLLELVGLERTGDRMVAEFSSGMRQRLMIARALIGDPSVLLLDEPTRSLDPVAARDLRAFVRDELCRRRGLAVILATHDPDEALNLCDRVGILHQGRLLALGVASEIARRHTGDRWALRARGIGRPVLDDLLAGGRIRGYEKREVDVHGWEEVEILIEGDEAGSALVLRHLVERDAEVARFEPRMPTLADLIESVVRAHVGPTTEDSPSPVSDIVPRQPGRRPRVGAAGGPP